MATLRKFEYFTLLRSLPKLEGCEFEYYMGGDPSQNHLTSHAIIQLREPNGKTHEIKKGRYKGLDVEEQIEKDIKKFQRWSRDFVSQSS